MNSKMLLNGLPLSEGINQQKIHFETREIKCSGRTDQTFSMETPVLNQKGERVTKKLEGVQIVQQGQLWSKYGCMEESAATSLEAIASTNNLGNLVKGKIFVMLGATSAICPFWQLAKLGAVIACVSRPGKKMQSLIERAKKSTSATLLIPSEQLTDCIDGVGADLLNQTAGIADWICRLGKDKQLVIGNYAYLAGINESLLFFTQFGVQAAIFVLSGEAHVRASAAMDIICEKVCSACPNTGKV